MDSRCCICANAYATQFVCKSCREDPANDGWVEGESYDEYDETNPHHRSAVPWGLVPVWKPTEQHKSVARMLSARVPFRRTAELLGLSLAEVKRLAREMGLL